MLLAVIFIGLELVWLSINALLASAAAGYLRRPLGKQGLNAMTGAVLVGLGLRLVAEPR